MSKRNPQVDAYLEQSERWQRELKKLRVIVLGCGLTEVMKWGKPCYAFDGKNVALLYRFKNCCALGFLKGSLLDDRAGMLVAPGAHSQAMRRLEFTDARAITHQRGAIEKYVHDAIAVAKSGREVDFKEKRELELPEELVRAFDDEPALEKAFHALTPGRQRGYVLHFSSAKQSKTRAARIAKHSSRILDGKGIADR